MEGIADSRILIPPRTKSRRAQAVVEQGIKAFFGGNALVAVIVLALITIFLFREGFGFFGQNLSNLRLYRQAGLEYVDIIRGVASRHEALSRNLSEIRLSEVRAAQKRNAPLEEINAALAPFDRFASAFSDTADNLHGIVSDLTEQASTFCSTASDSVRDFDQVLFDHRVGEHLVRNRLDILLRLFDLGLHVAVAGLQ